MSKPPPQPTTHAKPQPSTKAPRHTEERLYTGKNFSVVHKPEGYVALHEPSTRIFRFYFDTVQSAAEFVDEVEGMTTLDWYSEQPRITEDHKAMFVSLAKMLHANIPPRPAEPSRTARKVRKR